MSSSKELGINLVDEIGYLSRFLSSVHEGECLELDPRGSIAWKNKGGEERVHALSIVCTKMMIMRFRYPFQSNVQFLIEFPNSFQHMVFNVLDFYL